MPHLTAKNLPKIGEKKGKKNQEGSFTLPPPPTDMAGYATGCYHGVPYLHSYSVEVPAWVFQGKRGAASK